jgi:hypothetical protein
MHTASLIAQLISLALGVLGFASPATAIKLVGLRLDPDLPHSISEVRATYGGIFLGMSLYALVSAEPHACLALASAWGMAGVSRILSAIFDGAMTGANAGGIVLELAVGVLVALPWLSAVI